jgi:hypothetical protein
MRPLSSFGKRLHFVAGLAVATASILSLPRPGWSADDAGASTLREIKTQIKELARDRERDLDKIKLLEKRIEQVESENARLKANDAHIETQTSATTEEVKTLKQVVDTAPTAASFGNAFGDYLGTHQLTIAGAAAGSFIYDRQSAINTFSLTFEPLLLYRLNDWLLFEGTIQANYPTGSSADFQAPVADAHIFLNDYMEVVAGIFDQPFGDFDEAQSPIWVNRFVTAPLPYGAEAIVPPSDVGVQLRGGIQWGTLGQDFDYTTWVSNGPSYDNALPKQVAGEIINPVNNIAVNSNSKTFGARFRFYPFPIDANLGRLELGASTLDGKWHNGLTYNSWGVDFAYEKGNLQTRGEYLEAYRELPAGSPSADNRQGWYTQVGYFLNGWRLPHEPEEISRYLDKAELLVRYSGVNQRAIVADEISTVPSLGFNGSGSIFSPHAREVALGLDYWFAPSIVWQNEFDFEMPQASGYISTFGTHNVPTSARAGATANDRALLSQFTVGF